jgi:hypothetical protein
MPNKNAPKTSPRPQARRRREDEGSTRDPSGKNINEQDTQFFMNGGMAKKKKMMMGGQANMTPMMNRQGYKDGGDVRRADVRDNPKRGKCY